MHLFDANVFINAANNYYAFDLAPTFWDWLAKPTTRAEVASVIAVRDEVLAGTGDLSDWARQLPTDFWVVDDDASLDMIGQLTAWAVNREQYNPRAVDEFADSADIRLIATAAARGDTVVTNETPAPEAKKKIFIPDVCDAFTIAWRHSFPAFRTLGLRL